MTTRRLRFVLPIALAAVSFAAFGCSLIAVRGPPKGVGDVGPGPQAAPPCTTSGVAPALDTTVAAVTGLASVGLLAIAASPCSKDDVSLCTVTREFAALTLIPTAAAMTLFGWSAHEGFTRTKECREWLSALPATSRADDAVMEAIAASTRQRERPTFRAVEGPEASPGGGDVDVK